MQNSTSDMTNSYCSHRNADDN